MSKLRVLVACEFSGIVREAFASLGHDAWSCDLLETEQPGNHYQGDVLDIIDNGWDLMIAHPPCTFLTNSGVRWLHSDPDRWKKMEDGAIFFKKLLESDIPRIAVENPIMHRYAKEIVGAQYSQIVHPYHFGHVESKATCLWLKNLPNLVPTCDVKEQMKSAPFSQRQKIISLSPGPERWKERSRTHEGMARGMAEQWSNLV